MSNLTTQQQPKRRKSGSTTRQRGVLNTFRSTAEERAEMKANAAAAGLTFGSFIRGFALASPRTRAVRVPVPDSAHVEVFLSQVGRYTGNLRQLVRHLNYGGTAEARELAEIADEARDFLAKARRLWRGE
jgi:hypothetical protein